jgi:hypothetical protein
VIAKGGGPGGRRRGGARKERTEGAVSVPSPKASDFGSIGWNHCRHDPSPGSREFASAHLLSSSISLPVVSSALLLLLVLCVISLSPVQFCSRF